VSTIRSLAEASDNKARTEDLQRAVEELKSELEQHKYLDAAEQGMRSSRSIIVQ
jgi:AmiR/NasT family two-component response regulator